MCDRLIAQRLTSGTNTPSQSSGHLRNVKEGVVDDAVLDDLPDLLPNTDSNDTNEVDLFYFVHMRNHYL